MKSGSLPFEHELVELRNKIAELKAFTREKSIDLSNEITTLEQKAKKTRR